MNISKREKILLIGAIVAAVITVSLQFGVLNAISFQGNTKGELEERQKTYKAYKQHLRRKQKIEDRYRALESRFPKADSEKDPDRAFIEDIESLCTQRQITLRYIDPPTEDVIEGVDNYQEISVGFKITGDLRKVVTLLEILYQRLYVIKELKIDSIADTTAMDVELVVSRVSKIEERDEKSESGQDVRKTEGKAKESGRTKFKGKKTR